MKNKFLFLSLFLVLTVFSALLTNCKDEDDPTPLTLVSLTAGDIDLNGATAATTVPVEPVIVATFSTNIDASTATATNIKLERIFDNADAAITVTTVGNVITITPNDELYGGANYELSVGTGLKSTDGLAIPAFTRSFTTIGSFVPSGQLAYWNFEDNADDQVGTWNPKADGVVAISYVSSRNTAAGKAAEFNGTTSIIEYANADELVTTSSFSLSFWLKATDAGHGHFVMGLGAFYGLKIELASDFKWFVANNGWHFSNDLTRGIADLDYNGDGMTKDNGGFRATTVNVANTAVDALIEDTWAHIVYTFNSATKERSLYLNGTLVKRQDFNLYIADDGVTPWDEYYIDGLRYIGQEPTVLNELAFGFIKSRGGTMGDTDTWADYSNVANNHLKGQLDDVRIFHKALTDDEIDLMYNSEN